MKQLTCRAVRAVALATLFPILFTGLAHAATPPEVVKGQAWLQAQVQANGSLSNEALSIGTPLQNRAESLQTLKLLATVPSPLADLLAADTADNTEYLARRAITLSLAGRDTTTITTQLVAKQNPDGGFGGAGGYASNALDTALVMMAMAQNNLAGTPAGQSARGYLLTAIQADGGVGTGSDSARINASALAMLALQMVPQDLVTANALKQIDAWLLLKQGADGSWLKNSNLTALTLAAISPLTSDPAISANATSYLKALQGADGSWGTGDPFLTAVVLRALSITPPVAAPTSTITGVAVDQATTTPLYAATVTLSGAATATLTTAADGKINFANLPAGSYTLQIASAGYTPYTGAYQVGTGQNLNIGTIALTQILTSGIVSGKITAAATGLPLAGVTVTAGTLSATTDANGLYKIAGVTPGAVTLTASLAGYGSSTVSGTVLGGQTLTFSPALNALGAAGTATTGTFTGKVVAAGTNLPLPGVSILLNGTAAGVTDANGNFSLTLQPASYTAAFNLTGFNPATFTFALTAGASVNAGTIALTPQLTSTTISGIVKDAATGSPIGGAQVQMLNGPATAAGTSGAYTLGNLPGTTFNLRVSATGYVSQFVQLTAAQPMNLTQDFPLQVQTGAGLSLSPLQVNPGSVGANADVGIATIVTNAGAAANVVLTMQVLDSRGAVISTAAPYDKTGTTPLSQVTITPGQQLPVLFKWNTGQFFPGAHTVVARVVSAGTISRTTPLGQVVTQAQGALVIASAPHFIGTVTADPPVVQAGTNVPVKLSAVLQNDGNADVLPQSYQLTITNVATGAVVATQQVSGAGLAVNALQTLTFAEWIPAAGGGNFQLDLQAVGNRALGDVTGKVYVGDAATGTFTVNKLAVPAGTQTVKGNIHVTGQDNATGTISDPLAPLIKRAIQNAVTYNDRAASDWSMSGCLGCHVQAQAIVAGEMTRSLTTYDYAQRRRVLNMLAGALKADGSIYSIYPDLPKTQTMMQLWALNSVHNQPQLATTLVKAGNFTVRAQSPDGAWRPEPGSVSAWWASPVSHTALNLQSLIGIKQLLANAPAGSLTSYSLAPWAPAASSAFMYYGSHDMLRTVGDAAGNIYVSSYSNGTVSIVRPNGAVQQLMTGLSGPGQMALGSDGSLYVATGSGLVRRAPDGTATTLTTQPSLALAMGPDGNVYLMSYVVTSAWWGTSYDPTVLQVTPQGVVTTYFTCSMFGTYTPFFMDFDASGKLRVMNGGQILTINPDKSSSMVTMRDYDPGFGHFTGSWAVPSYSMIPDGDGWLVADTDGLYRYDKNWMVTKLLSTQPDRPIQYLNRLPNGKVMAGDSSTIYTLENTASYRYPIIANPPFTVAASGAAVDAAGNVYVTGGRGTWIDPGYLGVVKPDGTFTYLTGSGEGPPAIAADGSLYLPFSFGIYHYVVSTGQLSQVTNTPAANLAVGPDGNIYAITWGTNKIVQVTPAGVTSDYIVGGALNYPYSITFDKSGAMLVGNFGALNVVKYNPDKTYSVVVAKTNGRPYAILDDGVGYLVGTPTGLFRYDSAGQETLVNGGEVSSLARAPDGKIYIADRSAQQLYALRQMQDPQDSAVYAAAIAKAANWLLVDANINSDIYSSDNIYSNISLAFRLIGLGEAKKYYAGTPMAAALQLKIDQTGALLRSRQRADGGWGANPSRDSDSMVTAMVGMGLDYLNPSASDPIVQNAVKLLLSRQQGDGSWVSENGILSTHFAATTWVAIWLPIALDRLGGINADMTVSMPANVSLANPVPAPASSIANAAGGVDYLWHLTGVKSAGVDVNFDLTLSNMVLGENRPVASNAFLTFNNTFTGQPTTAPIAIPRVTASAFLGVGITTDQTNYGANTPLNITAAVNNTAAAGALGGSVKLEIYGADNILNAVVGTLPFSGLAPGAQTTLNATWNTATIPAGGYYVLATLYDAQNRYVGTAKSTFTVVGAGAAPGATGVAAKISVDKPAYQPFDRVQMTSRITNLLQNQVQSGLQTVLTVFRPDNTVHWTQTAPLQQLLAGAFIDLGSNTLLNSAPAGQYRIVLSVQTLGGLEVANASTAFAVLSTAQTGAGLTGTLGALPKIVPQTDPVVLTWTAANQGNAGFTALPVKLSIIDPVTRQLMAQQTYSIALAQGKSSPQTAFTWDTSPANVGSNYIAVLAATVGGKDIVLAQDNFLVTFPPVKLGVTQTNVRESRILVWAACNGEGQDAQTVSHQDAAHLGNDGRHSGDKPGAAEDHAETVPACAQARAAYLESLLTRIKAPHLITLNRADFRKAFREGRYNVYWLSGDIKLEDGSGHEDSGRSGEARRPDGRDSEGLRDSGRRADHGESEDGDTLAEEIREAVNRGDSLILDGDKHGGASLLEAAGLAHADQSRSDSSTGRHGDQPGAGHPANLQLTTAGALFATQTLATNGTAQHLRVTTGTVQAAFVIPMHLDDGRDHAVNTDNPGGDGQRGGERGDDHHPADDAHKPAPVWPAIVSNGYGKGHALVFGFDLVDTLQNGTAQASWTALLQTGLGYLLPPLPTPYSAGAYVELNTAIENQARGVDLNVATYLPQGSSLLQTLPQAVLDARGQPSWRFTLPQAATQNLLTTLRLPLITGNHKALTTIDSIRNGISRRYGEYSFYWQVAASDTLGGKLVTDLNALVLTQKPELEARAAAVARLRRALDHLAQARYGEAIEMLLGAVDKLRKITSVDTGDIRQGLDMLLQEAEWAWLRTGGDKLLPDAEGHDAGPRRDEQHAGEDVRRQDRSARRQAHNQDN